MLLVDRDAMVVCLLSRSTFGRGYGKDETQAGKCTSNLPGEMMALKDQQRVLATRIRLKGYPGLMELALNDGVDDNNDDKCTVRCVDR